MIDIAYMEKQLKNQYKNVFIKICLYGKTKKINEEFYLDRVNNIFNKLLTAQNTLKPVEDVVGRNLEGFCREFFKVKGITTVLQDLFELINFIALTLIALIGINYLISKETLPLGEAKISMLVVISVVIICCLFVISVRLINGKFKLNGRNFWVLGLFVILLVIAVDVLIGFIKIIGESNVYLSVLLVLAISGGYALIYNGVCFAVRYKRYGQIKSPYKLNYSELMPDRLEPKQEDIVEAAKDLKERYDKLKASTSFENFVEKIKAELDKEGQVKTIILVVCVLCVAVFSVLTYNLYGITAAGVMFAILIIVEFFLARTIIKMLKVENAATKTVIENICDRGISLDAYIKELTTIKKNIADKKQNRK